MKSVCFFNNKGGVGKTTLICNLASFIAKHHKKNILIIDADPQCNASAYLLSRERLEKIFIEDQKNSLDSYYNPIRKGKGYSKNIPEIVRSERFEVDLIVGDPKLSVREDLLATDWSSTKNGEPRGFQTTFAIKHLLSRLKKYDIVMIDMGPSLGALNRSILLSTDAFLMPLSVDIFSLMAMKNILESLRSWKESLERAIENHKNNEGEDFKIEEEPIHWKLKFLGYVMQQYKAKTNRGERVPVIAYERIIKKQREEIKLICDFFGLDHEASNLGEIPTLSSVIPLSQQAHAPIFGLESKDGIVGSHYTRVNEASDFFRKISEKFLERLNGI